MLANFSVEQSLMKAKSHAKKGELAEAQKLYEVILQNFSNNIRAQQGLASLIKNNQNNVIQNPPQEVVSQLVNLFNQGQFAVVAEQAKILTKQYPGDPVIWNILGASRSKIGMPDEAIDAYKKSIMLNPNDGDTYFNMGIALRDQGKLEESIDAYKKAISLKPDYVEAYDNIGIILEHQGKSDEAVEVFKKALTIKPDYAQAYYNMGTILKDQNKMEEAIDAYNKALLLKPDHAEASNNLGIVLQAQGMLEKAIQAYNKSIFLKPNYAEAYNNLGTALKDYGKSEDAIEAHKKSISLKPDYAEAYDNLGIAFHDQGKLEEAIEQYSKAISLKPEYVDPYSNMGLALYDQGKLEKALEVSKKSISLKPDYAKAHHNLSFILLRSNRLKEGLDESEWRWKIPQKLSMIRDFSQPLWDGKESLKDKRILIWYEQGIGDTLNWSSCLPLLSSCSKQVILECQEKLIPLLTRSFPDVEIKPADRSRDKERDDFDIPLPMGSLYRHFLDNIIQNPKPDAYLVPDPERVKYWKERLNSIGKGPYIGIIWKSSVVSGYRSQHYPPISEWSPVLKIPDVTFINLQYKDFADDLAKVRDELGVTVHNFEDLDQYNNVDDVVALCAALDMAVTTKVTPMIFSSAVGTPTKIANLRQSIWNTILNNPVSSAVDMFERNTWEPWDNVFKSIADDIFKFKTKN